MQRTTLVRQHTVTTRCSRRKISPGNRQAEAATLVQTGDVPARPASEAVEYREMAWKPPPEQARSSERISSAFPVSPANSCTPARLSLNQTRQGFSTRLSCGPDVTSW